MQGGIILNRTFLNDTTGMMSFIEGFPVPVMILDSCDGRILGVNGSAVSFYGYPREQFPSLTIFEINCLPKERVLAAIDNVRNGRQNFFRFQHRLFSGEVKDVEIYSLPVSLEEKVVMFSIIRDISDHLYVTGQLEERNRQLRFLNELFHLFEGSSDDMDYLRGEVEDAIKKALPRGMGCGVFVSIGERVPVSCGADCHRCVETYSVAGRPSVTIEAFSPKGTGDDGAPFGDSERSLVFMAAEWFARYLERITVTAELKMAKDRTERYLSMAGAFLLVLDTAWKIVEINEKGASIMGYPRETLLGRSWFDIAVPLEEKERVRSYFDGLYQGGSDFEENVESPVRTFGGEKRTIRWNNSLIRGENGYIKEILSIGMDVTDERRALKEVEKLTFHDVLTGLYNRNYLEKIKPAFFVKGNLPIGIVMGDVNGLKLTNDAFGHAAGDALLKETARLLRGSCREKDVVIRWGGDEFLALFPCTDRSAMTRIVQRIDSRFLNVEDAGERGPMIPSLTVGSAVMERLDDGFEASLKKAEDLMYQKKILAGASWRSAILDSLESVLRERTMENMGHIQRLTEQVRALAKALDLSDDESGRLELLARLHDIGLIAVSSEILMKEGPLGDSEWAVVRRHSEVGYRIARSTSSETATVAEEILSHHERWDGTGYPKGLKGEEIPFLSRILSVVDSFDVMTHDRPYKRAMSVREALDELKRCSGSQFDPYLVSVFVSLIDNLS